MNSASTPLSLNDMNVPALRDSRGRKALPRYKRTDVSLPGLVLQERDIALLEDLWQYRWLTTSQLALLRSADQRQEYRFVSRLPLTRRLKLLFHHQYVQRVARPLAQGSLEPVYILDKEGARILSQRHGEVTVRSLSQLPKLAALEHLLTINQFRVCLVVIYPHQEDQDGEKNEQQNTVSDSVRRVNVQLMQWQSSDAIKFTSSITEYGERTRKVTLIPDGFFSLKVGKQRLFYFVEVDLGSEPGKTLFNKCQTYYHYWRSGGFSSDFNVPPQVGFRVLFVAPVPKRVQTILSAIGSLAEGQTMFWVTQQEYLTPQHIQDPIFQAQTTEHRCSINGT